MDFPDICIPPEEIEDISRLLQFRNPTLFFSFANQLFNPTITFPALRQADNIAKGKSKFLVRINIQNILSFAPDCPTFILYKMTGMLKSEEKNNFINFIEVYNKKNAERDMKDETER